MSARVGVAFEELCGMPFHVVAQPGWGEDFGIAPKVQDGVLELVFGAHKWFRHRGYVSRILGSE